MKQNEGWRCPVCGRGVAPDQKYCECVKVAGYPYPQPYPVPMPYVPYPYTPWRTSPYWWESPNITITTSATTDAANMNATNYDEAASLIGRSIAKHIGNAQP